VLAGLPVPDLEEWAEHSCTVFCGVELTRNPPPWSWNANAANACFVCKVAWESGFRQAEGS
jgi:hypothetical protein